MSYLGLTALITGASSGLGEEFARQLAMYGANLVLVARSEEKLDRLAERFRTQWNTQVSVIAADLSSASAVAGLISTVNERGLKIDILVNNAGLGLFENFLATPLDEQLKQVDVNVRSLVTLTHAFTPAMVAAKRGGVINVASSAAFQPLAGASIYAASKAFVLFFSEALSLEIEKTGVNVLAVCPGPVATQFFAKMNTMLRTEQMDDPATIVTESLQAFEKKKKVVVPGKLKVWLGTFGARLLPRNVILGLAAGTVKQLNQKQKSGCL